MTRTERRASTYAAGVESPMALPSQRWPHDARPDTTPATSKGTMSSPNRAAKDRIGREKRSSREPQRMFLGKYMSRTIFTQISGRRSAVARPSERDTANTVSYTHLRAHETVLDLVCRLLL